MKSKPTRRERKYEAFVVVDRQGRPWATYSASLKYAAEEMALRLKTQVVPCTITYQLPLTKPR